MPSTPTTPQPPLVGALWRLVTIKTADRTTPLTAEDGTATLAFTAERHSEFENASRMQGDTGCNTFDGAYQVGEGQTLSVLYLSATEMYCGERMFEIEQAYLASLRSAASYRIEGDRLLLHSADGQSVLTLERR